MIFNYIFNTAGLAGGDSNGSGDGEEIAALERPNTVIKHGGEAPDRDTSLPSLSRCLFV